MKSFPCRWCWRGLQQNLVIFLAEQVETSNMGVSGATFGHQMLVFWFWEMEVVQKAEYQSLSIIMLLSPHSGWNVHAFSLVSWTLSQWQLQIFHLPGERRRSGLGCDPFGSTSRSGAAGSAGTAGEGERYGDGGVATSAIWTAGRSASVDLEETSRTGRRSLRVWKKTNDSGVNSVQLELAGLRVTLWYAVLVERFDGIDNSKNN